MMSSGTKAPDDMNLLGLQADLRLGVARGAQHVAGGKVGHPVRLDQPFGLRAFAGARRTDKYHAHGWKSRGGLGISGFGGFRCGGPKSGVGTRAASPIVSAANRSWRTSQP